MKVIILAAGRGSRLKKYTKYQPKAFNLFKNERYIDLIIKNFKENRLNNINIVTGYKNYLFKKIKYKKIYNSSWRKSNIFYSLYKTNKLLKKNICIISYSDIVFKKEAIRLLKEKKGDIVVLNNCNWKKTWKRRFKKPLNDLEKFNYIKKNDEKYLTEIGGTPKNLNSIRGQFAGLFKITPRGWRHILNLIKKDKIDIKKIDMTTFFSFFLKKKKLIIKIVDYKGMWFEIDTVKDFKILNSTKKNL